MLSNEYLSCSTKCSFSKNLAVWTEGPGVSHHISWLNIIGEHNLNVLLTNTETKF